MDTYLGWSVDFILFFLLILLFWELQLEIPSHFIEVPTLVDKALTSTNIKTVLNSKFAL